MMKINMSLQLVVLAIVVMFCLGKGCLEEETDALLQFKAYVLQNPNSTEKAYAAVSLWTIGGGESKSSCCDWERVECNLTTGRVISLSLHSLRRFSSVYDVDHLFNWNLNATMFLSFKELQYLNLSNNEITGWLENEGLERLSILPKLEVLDLSSNRFNSCILTSLNAFPSLKKLYLSNNMMTSGPNLLSRGSNIFSGLKKLEVLDLRFNYLGNSVNPSSLAEMTSLKELNLNGNNLNLGSDNLEFFRRLNKLEILDIGFNEIDNTTLYYLRTLTSLKKLSLRGIQSNGTDPSDDSEFDNTKLAYLGGLSSLKELDLSDNELDGTLPPGFLRLSRWNKLEILDLSYNNFIINDVLPSLATFTSLKSLSLSYQWYSLPYQGRPGEHNYSSLGTLKSLNKLKLAWNSLNGTFPKDLCKLKNLQELYLGGNNFHGILPSCLRNLTSLQVLDLSVNQFTGNLSSLSSSPIRSLTSLVRALFSYNNFEATFLLMSLSNHSKLVELRLVDNYVNTHSLQAKTDDHEYRQHKLLPKSQLKVLEMSNCNFDKHTTDAVLELLHDQYNLVELDLSHVGLQVDFPTWLMENNANLEILRLRNSSLKGQFLLPNHSRLSLILIDISNNDIQGTLQDTIGEILPNLKFLNLSTNAFRGKLPSSIGAMRKLEVLDLSSNFISGKLPESWALGCISLEWLKLSNNDLHGQIFPSNYSNLDNLQALHLDNNKFTGNIPLGVSKSSYLIAFNVAKNNLSGTIPAWMGNLMSLEVILLRENNLSGTIPAWMGNLMSLKLISLRENSLEGFIPREFCRLFELKFLDLSYNHDLSGSIPSCLKLPSLKFLLLQRNKFTGLIHDISFLQSGKSSIVTLNLGDNNFSGSIPSWIGDILELRFLSLKGNHLSGSIPPQLCQLKHIRILDLSGNKLLGSIPPCLMNITFGSTYHDDDLDIFGQNSSMVEDEGYGVYELSKLVEVEITTKSILSSYKGNMLNIMFGMDLSYNYLTGEIPHQIGELSKLHELNLSRNQLSGKIPATLSNMKQLESLDLSHNKLFGEIPSSLINLNFLQVFSVAYNNLWGRTLCGGQFGTFSESSYSGNPLLYIASPAKDCSSSTEDTPITTSSSYTTNWGDKYDIDTETFLVSFVVTCVIYMLGFFTVLWINPYWRGRWFHFIEARIIDFYLYFFIDLYYKVFVHPFM